MLPPGSYRSGCSRPRTSSDDDGGDRDPSSETVIVGDPEFTVAFARITRAVESGSSTVVVAVVLEVRTRADPLDAVRSVTTRPPPEEVSTSFSPSTDVTGEAAEMIEAPDL